MIKKSFVGVIGGTGIYDLDNVDVIEEYALTTPYGQPSDVIIEAKIANYSFYFLPRHAKDHSMMPSEINYRANIYALKSLGAKYIVSVSAVGSLQEEFKPTDFVLPDQFIDWTKGQRPRSFFGEGMSGYVSVANPVEEKLQDIIIEASSGLDTKVHKGGTYVCIEGPQFSSKAETAIYRSFGASVIGMTNLPEAYLAKEAGMAYATVAMVTDYDCWKESNCTVEEILHVSKHNNIRAKKMLLGLIPTISENQFDFVRENTHALVTDEEKLSKKHKAILEVLLS